MTAALIHTDRQTDGGKAPEICIASFHVVCNTASVCVHSGTVKQCRQYRSVAAVSFMTCYEWSEQHQTYVYSN